MFWDNLVRLCTNNKTTPTEMTQKLNIARGSVTGWKNGAIPHSTTLQKISDYFGVTTDELLADKSEISEESETKKELLRLIDRMDEKQIEQLKDYAEYIVKKE